MYTKFDYTVSGEAKSETVFTHSTFAFNQVVARLLKIADAGSIHSSTTKYNSKK